MQQGIELASAHGRPEEVQQTLFSLRPLSRRVRLFAGLGRIWRRIDIDGVDAALLQAVQNAGCDGRARRQQKLRVRIQNGLGQKHPVRDQFSGCRKSLHEHTLKGQGALPGTSTSNRPRE